METRLSLDYTSVFSVLSGLVEVGLVVLNGSGDLDFASERARQLLGCGDDPSLDACYPEIRHAIVDLVSSVSSGEARAAEQQVRFTLAGKPVDVLLEIHPIDEEACAGFLLLVKNSESMRRMATDLGLAAQLRNTRRLYRAVVQQLKQPISAVMLHADLVRNVLAPDDESSDTASAEARRGLRSLDVIKNQITQLNHALTLLMEEIEPADVEERGFSLGDVVRDVGRLVRPLAAQQGVDVEVITSADSARLTGSRQRIKQAILNLAVNALDAMPEGGKLMLEVSVRGSHAEIRVADTGRGIDEDVKPHIFEMHYTTKDTGTGVGLYVAREVVGRHGGKIELETDPGSGTVFIVHLPVSRKSP